MERPHIGAACCQRLKRRDLLAMVVGTAVVCLCRAQAQTARKRPLIGALASGRHDQYGQLVSAFFDGMRDHGYIEGQGFDFAFRSADADYARLSACAEELVSLTPDLIVALDPVAVGAVKKATSTIPIVAPLLVDPVNLGTVESYSRPGSNVTGITIIIQGLWGKVVELTRELVPSAAMIGLLFNPTNPTHVVRREIEAAAAASGVKVISVRAAAETDLDAAFKSLVLAEVRAVIVIADPMFLAMRGRIEALAGAAHLPTISNNREFVDAGGVLSYGVNLTANERRAADFVDKILKGAKAADLPVEFPNKLETIVNLKTAKALGLVVPPSIMLSADEAIE